MITPPGTAGQDPAGQDPAGQDPARQDTAGEGEVADVPADLRLLMPALVAWASGAALLGSPLPRLVSVMAVTALMAGVLTALAGWGRRRSSDRLGRWAGAAALTALAVVIAVAAQASATAAREAGPVRELADERAVVTVRGTVAADPKLLDVPSGRPETGPRVLVRLDVDRVDGRGTTTTVRSPIVVFGDRSWLAAHWQESIEVSGRLAPAEDPADDAVAVLAPRGPLAVVEAAGGGAQLAETVRSRFAEATAGLPSDAAGLLPGLVIGDTSRQGRDLEAAMLAAGMTHLSAVSGSNVAIVLSAALGLSAAVGLRRRWRPVLAAVLLCAFVVLVRPEPSVVRAAAMGAVGLVGLAASRRRAGLPALATAILVLLCWDPWLARSPGFALSALATLGLLLFAKPWGAAISGRLPTPVRSWGTAFAIPVAAQVMCAPVVVLLQGSVSIVSVPANLAAAPFVAPATILGVVTAAVSVVSTTAASWLAWFAAVPTIVIAWVARTAAAAPLAAVPWPGTGLGAVVLAAASLATVLTGPWLVHHAARRPALPAAVVTLGLAVGVPTHLLTWPLASWAFVACDVGQGDGLVLATGPGRAVVVDAGPDPARVDACLGRLGVTVLDAVVLTHFHADHVDGLPGVLRGRAIGQILVTPAREPPYQWEQVTRWADAARIPVVEVKAGDELAWPHVTARVLWPARVLNAGSVPNNASVVMAVVASGLRILLLGDVEREAATALLPGLRPAGGLPVEFDVVKVAHHGSGNRDDAMWASVRAPVAVISVGAGNDYGHPAASTLAALAKAGFAVYRTDVGGDVAVRRGQDGRVDVSTRG